MPFIKSLIINDCYGVPDKLKFGLTEGWNLTKHYLILADSQIAFNSLFSALQDLFVNYHLNTIDNNERSGIGINDDLFSGELSEDDILYLPKLKKISSSDNTVTFKFHKQSIVITTNPMEIFSVYDGNNFLTLNDIGFFSVNPNNTDFVSQLKDYSAFVNLTEEKNLKGLDLLNWLYLNIIEGKFLYKPNNPNSSLPHSDISQLDNLNKLIASTNLQDFINKDVPSMEDVVNNIHKKIIQNCSVPIDTSVISSDIVSSDITSNDTP